MLVQLQGVDGPVWVNPEHVVMVREEGVNPKRVAVYLQGREGVPVTLLDSLEHALELLDAGWGEDEDEDDGYEIEGGIRALMARVIETYGALDPLLEGDAPEVGAWRIAVTELAVALADISTDGDYAGTD